MKDCLCNSSNMRLLLKDFFGDCKEEGILKMKCSLIELEDFIQDWVYEHIELNENGIIYD